MININAGMFFVISVFALSGSVHAERLSGQEIQSVFAGRTANCIKTKDDSLCNTFMSRDGKVTRHTMKDNKIRPGTWHASKGDQLCIRWKGKKKDSCFDIMSNGNGTYNLDKKGKTKSIITGLDAGNTISK